MRSVSGNQLPFPRDLSLIHTARPNDYWHSFYSCWWHSTYSCRKQPCLPLDRHTDSEKPPPPSVLTGWWYLVLYHNCDIHDPLDALDLWELHGLQHFLITASVMHHNDMNCALGIPTAFWIFWMALCHSMDLLRLPNFTGLVDGRYLSLCHPGNVHSPVNELGLWDLLSSAHQEHRLRSTNCNCSTEALCGPSAPLAAQLACHDHNLVQELNLLRLRSVPWFALWCLFC